MQDLVQSLPESLQQFDLNLCCTKVSDLGKRMLPAHLTDLHLNLRLTEVNDSGVQGLMQLLPVSLMSLLTAQAIVITAEWPNWLMPHVKAG